MFGSLPHHEKQAFFSLMDEYFASRPHLLPSGPKSQPQSSSAGGIHVSREDLERAGKFAGTPVGQKMAGFAAGRALGNAQLGNAVAGKWAEQQREESANQPPPGRKGPPPPAPSNTKPSISSGIAGLQSSRSIGSLSLGSKTRVLPSTLSKNPPQSTLVSSPPPAHSGLSSSHLPPPVRRGPGISSPAPVGSAVPQPPQSSDEELVTAAGGIGMAEALYEYGDGTDPDDLPVKEGERIILLERISDDWWRGKKVDGTREEPGIVPSSYVRQL